MTLGTSDKEVSRFIRLKTAESCYSRESGCFGFTVITPPCKTPPPPSPPLPTPFMPPECLACTQSLMGLAGGLIEGRQLYWGAGSLAWVQGVAGLRGIGPCLLVMQRVWHPHGVQTHTHRQAGTHTQCIRYKHRKCFGSLTLAAGGLDGTGWCVRLAQFRGEQASNTNQGDLVMDAGLTESPFMFGWTGRPTALRSHTSCPAVHPALLGKSLLNFLILMKRQIICVPFFPSQATQPINRLDCCPDYISRLALPHKHIYLVIAGKKTTRQHPRMPVVSAPMNHTLKTVHADKQSNLRRC